MGSFSYWDFSCFLYRYHNHLEFIVDHHRPYDSPNLIGLLILHKEVKSTIKDYWIDFKKKKSKKLMYQYANVPIQIYSVNLNNYRITTE
jgi:hypothetical protein